MLLCCISVVLLSIYRYLPKPKLNVIPLCPIVINLSLVIVPIKNVVRLSEVFVVFAIYSNTNPYLFDVITVYSIDCNANKPFVIFPVFEMFIVDSSSSVL